VESTRHAHADTCSRSQHAVRIETGSSSGVKVPGASTHIYTACCMLTCYQQLHTHQYLTQPAHLRSPVPFKVPSKVSFFSGLLLPFAVPSSWRSCLTTRQRIGSLVKPVKYQKADGFVACGQYQYKCNSPQARPPNTTTCSAADVQSGAWQWHYTALTQQQCDGLPAEAARLGLRHAVCCLQDNCNMPDRAVDNSTEVVEWTGLVTSNNNSSSG
jgi:hypothetical protein